MSPGREVHDPSAKADLPARWALVPEFRNKNRVSQGILAREVSDKNPCVKTRPRVYNKIMKSSIVTFLCISYFCLAPGLQAESNIPSLMQSIQRETEWRPAADAAFYYAENLRTYLPQEAAVVLEYGLTQLTVQRLEGHGGTVTAELYEMLDPAAGYGLFTFFRSAESRPLENLGQMAAETDYSIVFFQSNVCVTLELGAQEPSLKQHAIKLGQFITKSLPQRFSPLGIVARLPKDGLVAGSEFFVLGHEALTRKYPFGPRDLFGLEQGAEAAMATYRLSGHSARLLLIVYPTQQLAKKFLESGYEEYVAQNPDRPIFYKREGPLVAMTLDSQAPDEATALLDRVTYVSSVTWDPQAQPVTVGQMMINVFIYVGVVVGLTLLAGLAFAGLRILIQRTFPGRIFDRPESYRVIRLDLKSERKLSSASDQRQLKSRN